MYPRGLASPPLTYFTVFVSIVPNNLSIYEESCAVTVTSSGLFSGSGHKTPKVPLTYFPEVRNSDSTEMGNLFWVPPKVRCPEKVVKGTGFNSIDVELSVGSYKLDTMNPTWIYVYEEGGVGFYFHVLKPIEIAPDPQRNCIVTISHRVP